MKSTPSASESRPRPPPHLNLDSSFDDGAQGVAALDVNEKSGYDAVESPRRFVKSEWYLHPTNRSMHWPEPHGDDRRKLWFVTQSEHLRECLAEFTGTLVMILFGMGVNNQVVLSGEENGTWLSINIAWGIAVLMGVYCSEGVSGGHLNPAVTFGHCVYGRVPWWKLPGYVGAQTLASFIGAALIFLLNYQKINAQDPDKETTQSNFATYPSDGISNYTAFYSEALATGMLLLCIYAITDQRNRSPGPVGTPFAFSLMIMALGMSFGMNTGYAMNPARDFGPRLFTYVVGYGSKVWTSSHYYFWIPIVGPLVGSAIGAGIYMLLVQIQHSP